MALIYIVEDDADIREVESIALKSSGHEIVDCENAGMLYSRLLSKIPDLIIVDIMLPDEDGYTIVRKLRNNPAFRKIPIMMVTAKESEIDMVKGLETGADDYITKPFSIIVLMTRVKALLRRTCEEEIETILQLRELTMHNDRHTVTVDNQLIELTYKEYELLKLLLSNVGVVMSRETIMSKLWDYNFGGETRTVDMHIKTLRHKLKQCGGYIKTVRNVGYIIE